MGVLPLPLCVGDSAENYEGDQGKDDYQQDGQQFGVLAEEHQHAQGPGRPLAIVVLTHALSLCVPMGIGAGHERGGVTPVLSFLVVSVFVAISFFSSKFSLLLTNSTLPNNHRSCKPETGKVLKSFRITVPH